MTTLAIHHVEPESQAIVLPQPRVPISIRLATLDDIPFIDALQKQHTKMVGFFPRAWFEQNIETSNVLIAEELNHGGHGEHRDGQNGSGRKSPESKSNASPSVTSVTSVVNTPVGYCVYKDKYLKREELGIVYQLNVTPGRQRGLIGAALVKAAFERCPYGVKLFCCWCAQDIEATYFWESIGFVPIAFRTGSRPRLKKDGTVSKPERIHIYWQRRIREGDVNTPYWFPSETNGGAVRENRLVLPIPPGTHWSDAKPAVLPGMEHVNTLQLPATGDEEKSAKPRRRNEGGRSKAAKAAAPPARPKRGLWFAPPPPPAPPPLTAEEKKAAKAKGRAQRPRMKNDPKLVAAAREFRDRYLEEVNTSMLLPPSACGKYDVSRQLEAAPSAMKQTHLLKAA
jgi:hypothetical protein